LTFALILRTFFQTADELIAPRGEREDAPKENQQKTGRKNEDKDACEMVSSLLVAESHYDSTKQQNGLNSNKEEGYYQKQPKGRTRKPARHGHLLSLSALLEGSNFASMNSNVMLHMLRNS
jgi:hypothetical protein